MRNLAGKVVAVTGAAGGIGTKICERLAAEQAVVHRLDSRAAGGELDVTVDVTSPESLERAVRQVVARSGRVDGLVAAAGVVEGDIAAEEMSAEAFQRTIAVNLTGVFLSCQAFGRPMLEAGSGSIVTISSMSGTHVVNTPQNQCAYNAQGRRERVDRSLAAEWGPRGVRVNAIAPGYVDTPLIAEKAHQFQQWLDAIPLARFAKPEEIAATVAFLLSDEAPYFCGSELLIDGGYSLR